MSNIRITFKDGTKREFLHEGRAGGSYTKSIEYKGTFIVVTDEYYRSTAFPAVDIKEVEEWPERY